MSVPNINPEALGRAKIKKKASFFSKKPGDLTWWSWCNDQRKPCIMYLCENQATPSITIKVINTINIAVKTVILFLNIIQSVVLIVYRLANLHAF